MFNPSPGSVVVDVFGFSRGAAAARHFINKLLALNLGRPLRVGFVGLFDTVAAIGSAADGLDTSDDNNLGCPLPGPRMCRSGGSTHRAPRIPGQLRPQLNQLDPS